MASPSRVYIYCRVSDPGATDDFGMAGQEAECRAFAERKGWDVVAVHAEYHTGTELFERPEMTAVRAAMRRHEFDVLLVDRLDRLSRDIDHHGFLRTEAKLAGVAIVSSREPIDDSPVGHIVAAAYHFKSSEQRRIDTENMARGKRTKVGQGKPLGQGKPAYGLAWKLSDDGKRRTAVGWQEDPATVGHLRRIFADYDAGLSLRQLAKALEADGVLPPYHDRTGSRAWSASTVRTILSEPLYVGKAEAFRTVSCKTRDEQLGVTVRRHRARPADERVALPAGVAPVVIDPAQFDRVQMRLADNRERGVDYRATRNPDVGILRRGLAYCGQCGNKLVVVTSRGVPSYRCQGRERTGCPAAVTIPVADVDRAVWDWLTAVLSDESRVRQHLDALRRGDPTADDLATNDRQRLDLQQSQAKFVAVISQMESPDAAGPIAAQLDVLAKQLAANARNRDDILARQSAWQREQAQTDDVLAFCRRVAADMRRVETWADRRAMAQALRVRFELWPADHSPRWVATSDVVPDVVTSASLYDTSECTAGT